MQARSHARVARPGATPRSGDPGVHGNIDLERTWNLFISLFYRRFKRVPTFVLWLGLAGRVRQSAEAPLEISDIAP